MGVFKDLVEPGALYLTLAAGVLINRHVPRRRSPSDDASDAGTPPLRGQVYLGKRQSSVIPDNTIFRNNLISRVLLYFPFLLEVFYWHLTYWPYQLARALSVSLIRNSPTAYVLAEHHALSLLNLERILHIDIEASFQHFLLTRLPWSMHLLAIVYHSHIILGVIFLVYAYTFFPRPAFQRIRRTLAIDNWIAFTVLTLWRCAPPRLLPTEYGYLDVLHPKRMREQQAELAEVVEGAVESTGSVWTNNSHQLTIAAMPSLHFGTSLLIGYSLLRHSPHRLVRLLAPLWPLAMLITIVGTANHFVLDAVVGAMVVALGWRMNELMLSFRPMEEWMFWALRTERPKTAEKRAWEATERNSYRKDELEVIKEDMDV
ncbi:hypothetical protein NA57DRAFT_63817 [Rhizodiscina lignyota]|uniref:Inositolphosphotransferase Aur1/Ipt1 domain-containing protein n=1 Tax=Rhizodiscina lignyota TaxID=1504668 RepID=A0A9P4IPS2_9PEZI|nr:hypothetical protein NA57DRAFT_63817 [Rhizodiscina lignyota]